MSATRPRRSSPLLKTRLGDLVDAAARDLDADAVLITLNGLGEIAATSARAGISSAQAGKVAEALTSFEHELGTRPIMSVRSLSTVPGEAAAALAGAGYASLVLAPVEIAERRVGALHILGTESGVRENEQLVRAYASHAAVTIAGFGQARRVEPPPPRVLDAVEEIGLTSDSFVEVIRQLDEALSPLFGAVRSGIMLWDAQHDVLQMLPGSFGADERTVASYQIVAPNARSNAARVFATGDPYISNRAVGDPAIIQDYVRAFDIERLLSMRLDVRGRRIGILHLINRPGEFTVDDIWRLQPLIPRIAGAVETANTLYLLRRGQRLEGILARVAVAIATAEAIQDFLTPAFDELCDVLEANLIALAPVNAEPIVWRAGRVDGHLEQELLTRASTQPARRADIVGPMHAGDPGSAALHVPVLLGSQRVGTLSTLRLRAQPFAADERGALDRLAKLAALAWATERYQQQRAELARIEERQRIADDLHDDVAQILFGAQMALDATLELAGLHEAVTDKVIHARALVVKGDEALRTVIHQLADARADDLAPELARVVTEIEKEFELPIRLEIADEAAAVSTELRQAERELLLRVAREALVNTAKHAGPCRAAVRLRVGRARRLMLTVTDDGSGIANGNGRDRHGLASLRRTVRSHGGMLRVRSSPGGTNVLLSLPLAWR